MLKLLVKLLLHLAQLLSAQTVEIDCQRERQGRVSRPSNASYELCLLFWRNSLVSPAP